MDQNVSVREGFGPPAAILGSGCEFSAEGKFCDKIATANSMANRRQNRRPIDGLPTPVEIDFSRENGSWGAAGSSPRIRKIEAQARSLFGFCSFLLCRLVLLAWPGS